MKRILLATLVAALLPLGPAIAAEQPISRAQMPKPALDAVARKYPNARMVKFAKEVEAGQTSFEVELSEGARKIDVNLSADGRILVEEELISTASVPEAVRSTLAAHATYGAWKIKRAERIIKLEKIDDPSYELVVAGGGKVAELLFDKDGKLKN
jgi:hypothetical protein